MGLSTSLDISPPASRAQQQLEEGLPHPAEGQKPYNELSGGVHTARCKADDMFFHQKVSLSNLL